MISPSILALVRRAILDLLNDIGGEHNDAHITTLLVELGHRVARRDIGQELEWLAHQGLLTLEHTNSYRIAEILPDGCDVANGRLTVEGISRHKSGR